MGSAANGSAEAEMKGKILSAANHVSGRPMLRDKGIFNVNDKMPSSRKKTALITFVLDMSMSMKSSEPEAVQKRIAAFSRNISSSPNIDRAEVSVITINQSQIDLSCDFQECGKSLELSFDYIVSGNGLSPIVSAAYIACMRSVGRAAVFSEHFIPVIVIFSDFHSNDDRYNGMDGFTVSAMTEQMNKLHFSDVIIVKAYIDEEQDNCRKLKGEKICFGNGGFNAGKFSEGLYWLYRNLFVYYNINDNDKADDPFGASDYCTEKYLTSGRDKD